MANINNMRRFWFENLFGQKPDKSQIRIEQLTGLVQIFFPPRRMEFALRWKKSDQRSGVSLFKEIAWGMITKIVPYIET